MNNHSYYKVISKQKYTITQRLTTAYHPQSNASKRANQEIFIYLRAFSCYAQNNWMDLLSMAQLALNARPNSAIGNMSPFFLRHGYELDPLMEPTITDEIPSRHPVRLSAIKYVQRLRDVTDFAQAAMVSAQQRNETNGNQYRRQPEKFKVGDKVWLNLRHIQTPQFSKKLAWQHAKYELTAVPDALNIEINVPGNIHKRFHVELIKRVSTDPFPSQIRDDKLNPPTKDGLEEPEFEIESILRARTIRRGRGTYRQASFKWVSEANPTWEPIEYIIDTKALDGFEALYGSINTNDGPPDESIGSFVGSAEQKTIRRRRERRRRK